MAKLDSGAMTIGNNDNWREIFDDQNATAQAANQATADLAPIINGKRCALSVASGGFVLLRNSTITGKADGAYTAAKAIPANTDLDGSYLTAISGGVANALNGNITPSTPNLNIDTSNVSSSLYYCRKIGRLVMLSITGICTPENGKRVAYNLPKPDSALSFVMQTGSATSIGTLDANGTLTIQSAGIISAVYIGVNVAYVTA